MATVQTGWDVECDECQEPLSSDTDKMYPTENEAEEAATNEYGWTKTEDGIFCETCAEDQKED